MYRFYNLSISIDVKYLGRIYLHSSRSRYSVKEFVMPHKCSGFNITFLIKHFSRLSFVQYRIIMLPE